MRYLNSVYVRDHQARVNSVRGSIVVSSPDGKQRIPLEAIDAVIMFAGQVTTQALALLVRNGVRVADLTKGGKIRFTVHGPISGNVHLRQAQHAAAGDPGCALEIARNITLAKLQNSHRVIGRWARDHPDPLIRLNLRERAQQVGESIAKVASADTIGEARGIEGDAGRAHFGAVRAALKGSDLEFGTRSRRPPRDPVNALLGFCYALTTTETSGAAEAAGLDPQIGFLHAARSGRASLALDLLEELRPLVDRFVVGLARRKQIRDSDFLATPGGACYLTDEGRDKLLRLWEEHKNYKYHHHILDRKVGRWALPTVQATLMARHLRGDLPGYPPFLLPA